MRHRGGAAAGIGALAVLALAACGSSTTKPAAGPKPAVASALGASPVSAASGRPSAPVAPSSPPAPATLPDGSTTILPGHRVVAYYGTSTTPPDNALPDAGTPQQAAAAVLAHAKPYATPGTPTLGAFELISTIIQGAPGVDGTHAVDLDLSTVQKYEDAAVKNHLLLILDIQPGTTHFLPHVQRLAKFLAMPNVSIGLDPEWQFITKPYGDVTGNTTGAEVNTVSSYLSSFIASHHLPQKLMMIHQFNTDMIEDRSAIKNEPGVAIVMHIDGIGNGGNAGKIGDYKTLHGTNGQFSGFKLFFKEDTDLMTPPQVLALKPVPDVVTYQ